MSSILQLAKSELIINLRNRWIVSFAIIFMMITFMTSYFGMVTAGYAGFQDFIRTSASLVNICGFLIPLLALILGVFSFIADPEFTELMLTQPVTRHEFILGKYLGLCMTLFGTTLIGFGLPGVIISLRIGTQGAFGYAIVVLLSLLLGMIFIGLAILISIIVKRQQLAMGMVIGVWLLFGLIYGLAVIGTTLYLSKSTLQFSLVFLLLGNPIDLVRVLTLTVIGGTQLFGPAGASLIKLVGSQQMIYLIGGSALILWLTIPVIISGLIFQKQDV
ncbi:ABC transporter permease [Calditrichota bacterium]